MRFIRFRKGRYSFMIHMLFLNYYNLTFLLPYTGTKDLSRIQQVKRPICLHDVPLVSPAAAPADKTWSDIS
jgi:hypothetical protein